MKKSKERCVYVIVGPTASGKSRLSIRIAHIVNGEIISADSRQVYKYMDIGTAKPSIEEQEDIPHYCFDIKNPDEYFSAGEYGRLARRIVNKIFSRNRMPIVVGGSGLYIRALVDGMFWGNYRDSAIRESLRKQAEEKGLNILYNRLKEVDPASFQKIHQNDKKRIVRALEVYELSGKPISQMQKEKTQAADFYPCFWGLRWPREVLYQRIEMRVDKMIQSGFIQEVEKLLKMGFDPEFNSMDSVGYREICDYLNGHLSLDDAVNLIKQNTRRFAKKQIIWFRRDPRIRWIDLQEPVDWDAVAEGMSTGDE